LSIFGFIYPDNEGPIVLKYVSNSKNQRVSLIYCDNCGEDLHQTAKSLQMKQDQWFRNFHCVAEAKNVNEQDDAENDREVDYCHVSGQRLKHVLGAGRR
jgi:transcription elongation factor Elf1